MNARTIEQIKVWLLCLVVFVVLIVISRWRNEHRDPDDHYMDGQMGSTDYP